MKNMNFDIYIAPSIGSENNLRRTFHCLDIWMTYIHTFEGQKLHLVTFFKHNIHFQQIP